MNSAPQSLDYKSDLIYSDSDEQVTENQYRTCKEGSGERNKLNTSRMDHLYIKAVAKEPRISKGDNIGSL